MSIGLYCRISSEIQDNNFSIQEQKNRGIRFAKSLNEEYTIFEDIKSGSTLNRPSFSSMMKKIESGEITKIWVIEFSRLSRNAHDSFWLRDYFIGKKINLYINGDLLKLDDIDSFLNFGINSLISDYERQRIRERMQRGIKLKKETGGQWFRYIYGYKKVFNPETGEKITVINEEQAEIVRQVFHDFAVLEKPYKRISTDLNERQIPALTTNTWDTSKIMRMTAHEIYTGYYHYEGKKIKSLYFNPIISEELFEKAIARKKIISQGYNRNHRYTNHKCSSITKCYYCNSNLIHHKKIYYLRTTGEERNNYIYKIIHNEKTCKRTNKRNTIKKSIMDVLIDNLVIRVFTDRKSINNLYEKLEAENTEKKDKLNEDIQRYNSIIQKETKKKSKLMELLLDDDFTDDEDIKVNLKSINQAIKQAKNNITNIHNQQIITEDKLNDILHKLSVDYVDKYFNSTDYNKRTIIMEFTEESYIKEWVFYIKFITGKKYTIDLDNIPERYTRPLFTDINSDETLIWWYSDNKYDYIYNKQDRSLYRVLSNKNIINKNDYELVYSPVS